MSEGKDDRPPSGGARALHTATYEGTEVGSTGTGGPRIQRPFAPAQLQQRDPRRYEHMGERGRGGLGCVVEVYDLELDRTVAVKQLLRPTSQAEARFIREAKITGRLEHPGIVPIHDVGRWPNGEPFYSMKLVSGRTLRDVIKDCPTLNERLSLLPNVLAVADAIAYAHSNDIIHRDLKPSNVIVGEYGETVVVDWGLAKDLAEAEDIVEFDAGPYRTGSNELTMVGDVMGTPAYMPPEQARGERVDARADVYALGAMLYHTLAGDPPYIGDTSEEILEQVLADAVTPIEERQPGVPADLAAVIAKATARDRAERYATAREFADDLKRYQTGKLVTAHDYSAPAMAWRWVLRHKAPVAVGGIMALILVAFGVVSIQRILDEQEATRGERRVAEARAARLILEQARSALASDPTKAAAWLKFYPPNGLDNDVVREIASEAAVRGIASHVFRVDRAGRVSSFAPDGQLLIGGADGAIEVLDLHGGSKLSLAVEQPPNSVAFSPTRPIVVISPDRPGPLQIWDLETGSRLRLLEGPQTASGQAEFSSDGDLVAVGSVDRKVRVWNVSSGELVRAWELPVSAYEIEFIGDSGVIAAGGIDGALNWLNVRTGDQERVQAHVGAIHSLDATPDGTLVSTAGADSQIRVWTVETRQSIVLEGHEDEVGWTRFVPGTTRLVSLADDRTMRLWSLEDRSSEVLVRHGAAPQYFDVSDDGRYVASTAGAELVLFDLVERRERHLLGHADLIQVDFSADGRRLASASRVADDVRVWSVEDSPMRALRGHDDAVFEVAVSTRGGLIAAASFDHSVTIWSATGALLRKLTDAQSERVTRVQFASDDQLIAVGADTTEVRLFEVATGEQVASWSHPDGLVGHLCVSPDGERLASVVLIGTVVAYDLRTSKTHLLEDLKAPVRACTFSAAGELAITHAGGLSIWDEQRGLRTVFQHEARLLHVAYSPRDKFIVVTAMDGAAFLLETSTWEVVKRLDGAAPAGRVAFSRDQKLLAISFAGGIASIYELSSWAERHIGGHTAPITAVEFSPDSSLLATGSGDSTVRVWDVANAGMVVLPHGSRIRDLAFTADGEELITGSYDHVVRSWNVAALRRSVLVRDADLSRWVTTLTTATLDVDRQLSSRGQ